jgi:hypothetical protein
LDEASTAPSNFAIFFALLLEICPPRGIGAAKFADPAPGTLDSTAPNLTKVNHADPNPFGRE